jgi:hypothetical protein
VYPLSKLETFPPLTPVISTRRVTAANICRSLDVFNKHNISLEDIYSFA